jgi:hypothetical protein
MTGCDKYMAAMPDVSILKEKAENSMPLLRAGISLIEIYRLIRLLLYRAEDKFQPGTGKSSE